MFETGDGVPPDDKKALDLYRRAAEQGAQRLLAGMLLDGRGGAVDLNVAVNWFREAAALGDAIAQRRLGEMYQAGKGVEADRHAAKVFYRRAAEQGEAIAQWRLGNLYAATQGMKSHLKLATHWWRKRPGAGIRGRNSSSHPRITTAGVFPKVWRVQPIIMKRLHGNG